MPGVKDNGRDPERCLRRSDGLLSPGALISPGALLPRAAGHQGRRRTASHKVIKTAEATKLRGFPAALTFPEGER